MSIKQLVPVICLLAIACCIFVFSPVAAQQVIIPFQVGQTLLQNVSATQTTREYHLTGLQNESLFLLALAQDYDNTPAITLMDDSTNRTVAMVNLDISGMCLRIAPGQGNYTLNVTSEESQVPQFYGLTLLQDDPNAFSCNEDAMASLASAVSGATLENTNLDDLLFNVNFIDTDGDGIPDGPPGVPTRVPPVVPPVNPPGPNGCQAASGSPLLGVNIRALASTGSNIIGNIPLGDVVNVLGLVNNSDFLLVDNDGLLGFASSAVVQLGGNCSSVPLVDLDGTVVIGLGDTVDLGVNVDLDVADLIDVAVDAGATLNGSGVLVNLNADAGTNGTGNNILDVDATVGLDDGGLNLDADATVLDGDLLDVDAGVGVGEGGVTVDAGVQLGNTPVASVGVNLGSTPNAPIVDVQVPIIDTGVTIGGGSSGGSGGSSGGSGGSGGSSGGSCIVVLGIPIGC